MKLPLQARKTRICPLAGRALCLCSGQAWLGAVQRCRRELTSYTDTGWGEVYLSEGPSGKTVKEREPFVNERLRALIAYVETLQQ
jgi:hypothetical protein